MPSMLTTGCDYSVFKSDIKPMWEDPTNKNGGRWLIKDNGLLDQYWMDIVIFILPLIFIFVVPLLNKKLSTYIYVYILVVEYDWRNV